MLKPKNSFDLILPHLPAELQEAIRSPDYTELCVTEDGRVFVEAAGKNSMVELPGITVTQTQLRFAVNAIARLLAHREADENNPILNASLPDGSRIAVLMPPLIEGIALTVRKFRLNWFTLEELLANHMVTETVYSRLQQAIDLRENILISGQTGSGKTTLVKALLDRIPQEERIFLIEDTPELPLNRPNRVHAVAYEPVTTIRDLVKAALRHRPDRIVVGEVRDGAAYDLLQALNTGHAGSISTLHARSAQGALNKLARLTLQADTGLPFVSIQSEIGDAIQHVVHIERKDGRRQVTEMIQVNGFNPGKNTWEIQPYQETTTAAVVQ